MAESKRASNWKDNETFALLGEIALVHETLFARLNNSITLAQKQRLWVSIVIRVNAIGGQKRDVKSCKKRWRDLKFMYLHNQRHAGQTGGGKPAPTTPYDEIIGHILGENTSLVSGIAGRFVFVLFWFFFFLTILIVPSSKHGRNGALSGKSLYSFLYFLLF